MHIFQTVFLIKTTSLIFYATITNIIIIPFLFLFGTPTLPSWPSLTVIFIVAVIDVFYQIPYYIALRKVDTSIMVVLFSLGEVSVPILAYFIVDEKLSLIQYTEFGIIFLSSFLLNFDRKQLKLNVAFFSYVNCFTCFISGICIREISLLNFIEKGLKRVKHLYLLSF